MLFTNYYFTFFTVSILPLGYLYIFDWPQSLSTRLQQQPYNYTLNMVNLLYTFTSVGTILIIFKVGNILDKIPYKISLLVVPFIMIITQLVTTLMFKYNQSWSYYIVSLMRIIFGISGQCMFIIQAIVCSKIYKQQSGKYIGYSLGVTLVGSPLNSFISPILASVYNNLILPQFVGFLVCVVFLGIGGILIKITNIYQKLNNQALLLETQNHIEQIPDGIFKQIKQFPIEIWILNILAFLQMSLFTVFNSLGIDYMVKRFNVPYQTSGALFIIPTLIATFSTFSFWIYVKINLRNSYLIITSTLLLSHLTLCLMPNIFQPSNPSIIQYIVYSICFFMLGLSLGGYGTRLVSSFYLFIKPQNYGAATGMLTTSLHLSFIAVPIISSVIVQAFKTEAIGYKYLTLYLYLPLSIIGFTITLYLKLSKNFNHLDKMQDQIDKKVIPIQQTVK